MKRKPNKAWSKAKKDFYESALKKELAFLERKPPKPDPFEQWWRTVDANGLKDATYMDVGKLAWDAAMKYKEGL